MHSNWVKISEKKILKNVPENIKELWSKGKLLPPIGPYYKNTITGEIKSSSVKIREEDTEPSLSVSSVEYINECKDDLLRLIREVIKEVATMKPNKLYRITDLIAYKTRSKKKNFHWDIVRYFMNAIQNPGWPITHKDVPRIQVFADEKFIKLK